MKLKVITPERIVLEENVEAVFANTLEGEVGVLPKHIPMVASMGFGVMRYVKEGQKKPVAIMGGVLHTNGEDVSILSNAAEAAGEIDVVRAQHAKERAEAFLQAQTSEVDHERARAALSRAIVRIKVTQSSH